VLLKCFRAKVDLPLPAAPIKSTRLPSGILNNTFAVYWFDVNRAWYAAVVLMLCYALSFVDRQILGLLVPFIKADLRVNDTMVGLLQGLSFALFYAAMGLPLGRVADSTNRRNLISICIAFWSFFTAGCSLARSYTTLFLARTGVGIGEAGLNPASFSILSDLFPK